MNNQRSLNDVYQVFCEIEYVGKYISETKATCQWVLAFPEYQKEKVSFTVHDSTISGKKEILQDGVPIYTHTVTHHPKEIFYQNDNYLLTVDYYCYFIQHIIHIQVLQKKGIMSMFAHRVFRLFVDNIHFDCLPLYYLPQSPTSRTSRTSRISRISNSSSISNFNSYDSFQDRQMSNEERSGKRSRSREIGYYTIPIHKIPFKQTHQHQPTLYSQPLWLIGRID